MFSRAKNLDIVKNTKEFYLSLNGSLLITKILSCFIFIILRLISIFGLSIYHLYLNIKLEMNIFLLKKVLNNKSLDVNIKFKEIEPINIKTEYIQFNLIRKNPLNIKYIKYPTERTQLKAVEKNKKLIKHIKNPYKSVQEFCYEK